MLFCCGAQHPALALRDLTTRLATDHQIRTVFYSDTLTLRFGERSLRNEWLRLADRLARLAHERRTAIPAEGLEEQQAAAEALVETQRAAKIAQMSAMSMAGQARAATTFKLAREKLVAQESTA